MFPWSRCERRFGPLIAERHAGALSAADALALERHLQGCARCRAWHTDVGGLVEGMQHASTAGTLAHPAPEDLAALSAGGGGLRPEERASIEHHLEVCADCRAEWNVASRWNPGRLPVAAAAPRPARWAWFAAGAASAAAAAVLLAMVLPRDRPPVLGARAALESTGAPVQLRGAHHRAAHEASPLPVPSSAEVVIVVLTVEAPPRSALEVEMRDDAGVLLAREELTLEDPSGSVMLSVVTSRLPSRAGEFRVRVTGTGEIFRFPFRVERRGD
jgi:hypothetical protein